MHHEEALNPVRLKRQLEREREARKQAESLLENKSRELYESSQRLRDANTKLEQLAYRDSITDLPNRRVLERALEQFRSGHKSTSRIAALYLIDLNDFNFVAGTLGQSAADALLVQVSERLRKIADSNDMVVRIGGDEFAVLQIDRINGEDDARQFAKHFCDRLAKPYFVLGNSVYCSASMGVTMISSGRDHAVDRWFTDAEIALAEAKTYNRGSYVLFDERLRAVELQRLASRQQICAALDSNQFETWLQPQINLKDGTLAGYESLARWRHPDRGIVGPGEFIPTLEHMGLATEFGTNILQRSFALMEKMRRKQIPIVKVGVNLSSVQLIHGDIVDTVRSLLRQYDMPEARLELEITEGSLLHDSDRVHQTLQELRAMGVSIALDDFGTGYSSLSYLRTLPIDRLKIDRSFIQELPKDVEACGIIIAIVQMAKALELEIVAEGIESQEQANLLRCVGVDVSQGFLHSKPLAPNKILTGSNPVIGS